MDSLIYLDTYVLQQDMRIRMPKAILSNLCIEQGKTKFDIFLDVSKKEIILRTQSKEAEGVEKNAE
jgi:hypothetical protein